MDPLTVSAIITGGASLASSLFGSSSAKSQSSRESANSFGMQIQQQIYNTQERIAAQKYNTEMWEREQEYNTPANQLERAMDAGINPNAVFGSGISGNTTTSAPSITPQSSGIASLPSIAGGMLTSASVNTNLMAQAAKTAVESAREKVGLSYDEITFQDRVKNASLLNEKAQAEINGIYAKANLDDVSADVQWRTFNIILQKSEHELDILKHQVNIAYNQNQNLLKDLEVKDKHMAVDDSSIALNKANTRLANENADLANVNTDTAIMNNDLKQLEVHLSNLLGAPIGTKEEEVLFGLFKTGQLQSYIDYVEILAIGNDAKGSNWLSKILDKWRDYKRNTPLLGVTDLGEKNVEFQSQKFMSKKNTMYRTNSKNKKDKTQPYRATYSNSKTMLNPKW